MSGTVRKRVLALCIFISCASTGGISLASDYGLSKIETPDLRLLYYDPIQTYLTPYVAQSFENSIAFQEKTFGWKPWEKATVYLRDLADAGGASVRAVPSNELTVDIAPVSTIFETFSPGERFFLLMNHELVHVATMDVWNQQDAGWRNFFHGKPLPVTAHPETILYNYLAAPRTNVPRWYLEGSAVFMETWMGGGLGRAQGGYDEMVFRAMVRDNAKFFDPLGLEAEGNSVDFQVGANDYLYGTRFMSYLALTYGPDKVIAWLKRGEDSEGYYSNQFEKVFGKPLDDVWAEWVSWEHGFQKTNLASVAKYPLTPTKPLIDHALGSVSRSFYDPKTNSLIVGYLAPGVLPNIGVISLKDGTSRRLTSLKGPALYRVTSLAYDPDNNKAYFTTDNDAWRDVVEVDVATGETKMLLPDSRIGELAFNRADGSIWGVRHLNGLDTLVRIKADHTGWNQVITFPYGHSLSDLDISPDGTLLSASVGEINGDQRIEVYRISDLLEGNTISISTLELGTSIPEGGTFSPDGRYLYATAYYTGVSNLYRLDIAANTYDAMTNAETGFFRPIPLDDGSVIVYEYTGQGFQPVKIDPKPIDDLGNVKFLGTVVADTHPEVKDWAVGSPSKVNLDAMITDRGDYQPDQELHYDASYPILAGYKGHIAGGWHFQFEDPMQFNQLQADLAYSPANNIRFGEQFHGAVRFSTLFWHFTYWHNYADFYDLFGPTDRSRKGDAIIGTYHQFLIYDTPRQLDVEATLAGYSGLDVLPGAQNVSSGASSLATGSIAMHFSNVHKSLGAVDYEAGYRANGEVQVDYQRGELYPKVSVGFDFGTSLPLEHSSLWLYNSAGASFGGRISSLNNFYFGAFGNNYVDDGEVKRYRDYDSFPGLDIDAASARKFLKSLLEWNLPPVRFEDVGTPAFYLSSARPALFAGVLDTNPGSPDQETYETVGGQIDWNFTIAVRLPMTLSLGYAKAFGTATGRHDELMVSLKIL